jgi:hypothetical protein
MLAMWASLPQQLEKAELTSLRDATNFATEAWREFRETRI